MSGSTVSTNYPPNLQRPPTLSPCAEQIPRRRCCHHRHVMSPRVSCTTSHSSLTQPAEHQQEWLIDRAVVLRPTQHKTGHFRDVSQRQSLG